MLVLLSPLQSSAALLAGDVIVLQQQVALLTEAINSSNSITAAKKTELTAIVSSINNIIAVLAQQVAVDPNAVSQRRVNIEDVIVTGDAKDFDSQVKIVWGPETIGGTSYQRSTSTYNYDFVTTLAESNKIERLSELSNLTFSQLAAEIGFSASMLRSTSTISFKRFDDENDANNNYTQPPNPGGGLEQFFGEYSIIDNVSITAGKDIFSIAVDTDQDETVVLTVAPLVNSSKYVYTIAYLTYDDVRGALTNNNADQNSMKDELVVGLSGIGKQFGVSDEVLVDELLDFMLQHTVVYKTDASNPIGPGTCHSAAIKNTLSKIAYYFIDNFQVASDVDTKMFTPVEIMSADPSNPPPQCFDVDNSFFSALP